MTRDLVIRAIVAALLLLGAASFVIDWNQLVLPGGLYRTLDASLDGNPTQLKARVAGYLASVPVVDDSAVRRGDLLFAIEDRDFAARVARAQAALAQAQAAVAVADAQIAQQGARIGAAQAEVAGAAAGLVRANQEQARQAQLLHTESYLARDWENAQAADQGSRAQLQGRRRALTAAEVQTRVLVARRNGALADVAAAQAALDAARVALGYTRIVAPFDAVATARLQRVGDYVAAGTALITLEPRRGAWVVANFREVQLTHMRAGQPARVAIDALPGRTFAARVDSIGPVSQAQGLAMAPDRAAGSFTKVVQRVPVKLVFEPIGDPAVADRLLPGLSAEAEVDTSGETGGGDRLPRSPAAYGGPQ